MAHAQHTARNTAGRPPHVVPVSIVLLLVLGTAALYLTFTVSYESSLFFKYSALLATCWAALYVAGCAVQEDRGTRERAPLVQAAGYGVLGGAAIGVISVLGAWTLALIPLTSGLVESVLGPVGAENFLPVFITAIVVGAAEELAFRGGVFVLFRQRPLLWSTLLYALVTCATLNPALVLAAAVLGVPFAWLRAWTGRVIAPVVAHMVWTCVTLGVLTLII